MRSLIWVLAGSTNFIGGFIVRWLIYGAATWENVPSEICVKQRQLSLRIQAVWSVSSLSSWRNFTCLAIQNTPKKDSDQTVRIRRLIWVFATCTCPKVRFLTLRFSCRRRYNYTRRKLCIVFSTRNRCLKPSLRFLFFCAFFVSKQKQFLRYLFFFSAACVTYFTKELIIFLFPL